MDLPKIDSEHGATIALLYGIGLYVLEKSVLLAISIIKSLRHSDEKRADSFERKADSLDNSLRENTLAVYDLTRQLKTVEQRLVDTDREALKLEARHTMLVATVKELAGERWQEIQRKIKDDQFIERPERE